MFDGRQSEGASAAAPDPNPNPIVLSEGLVLADKMKIAKAIFSPCSKYLTILTESGYFITYDSNTRRECKRSWTPCHNITAIAYSPTQNIIVAGTSNGILKIFSTGTYEFVREIRAHKKTHPAIVEIEFAHEGLFFATRADNGKVRVWSTRDYSLCTKFLSPPSRMSGEKFLAFYPPEIPRQDPHLAIKLLREHEVHGNVEFFNIRHRPFYMALVREQMMYYCYEIGINANNIDYISYGPGGRPDTITASFSERKVEIHTGNHRDGKWVFNSEQSSPSSYSMHKKTYRLVCASNDSIIVRKSYADKYGMLHMLRLVYKKPIEHTTISPNSELIASILCDAGIVVTNISRYVDGKLEKAIKAIKFGEEKLISCKEYNQAALRSAADDFRCALELDPTNITAIINLCNINMKFYYALSRKDCFQAAKSHIYRALEIDPHNAEALKIIYNMKKDLNQHGVTDYNEAFRTEWSREALLERALNHFDASLELDQQQVFSLIYRSKIKQYLGNISYPIGQRDLLAEAQTDTMRILSLEPCNEEALKMKELINETIHAVKKRAQERQQKNDEATERLRKAAEAERKATEAKRKRQQLVQAQLDEIFRPQRELQEIVEARKREVEEMVQKSEREAERIKAEEMALARSSAGFIRDEDNLEYYYIDVRKERDTAEKAYKKELRKSKETSRTESSAAYHADKAAKLKKEWKKK